MATGSPRGGSTRSLREGTALPPSTDNFLIRAVSGSDSGKSLRTSAGRAVIGSDLRCDLPLTDPFVSRQHLRITQEAGRLVVEDLGSKNGSTYLRARFERIVVPYGSVVVAGKTSLRLLPVVPEEIERFGALIGHSKAARQLFSVIEQVAQVDNPVLIEGPSGSGKDEVARLIHELSPRHARALVFFDCVSTPPSLLHSALLGHTQGAFTGATEARAGAFEAADGGTLVLNGIDDVPLDLQTLLLRATESKTFVPLGRTEPRRSDFRLVCAVSLPAEKLVKQGKLRQDLFFRISALKVEVPPLSARVEDIPALASSLAAELGVTLEPEQLVVLVATPWPGNIRELRNAIERLAVLGHGRGKREPTAYADSRDTAMAAFEATYLKNLVEQCDGNVTRAAKVAGVARSFFYRLLKRHGLSQRDTR